MMRVESSTNGKFEQVAKRVIITANLLAVAVAPIGCE